MSARELAHLELLAEVDSLAEELRLWSESAPPWQPARAARALVRRLIERVDSLRVRLDAPLVVAMLGGSGTGKSALVNAILGSDVVTTGRQRPTTQRPVLVCRPDIGPEMLGIDPGAVELCQRELPALADLVLVDCPDPDTSEQAESTASNLARLRRILPHCDVLVVTTTQQKYRSGRVSEELAAAAPGARLVFVQTHADEDDDVREDWQEVLRHDYAAGRVYLVDSLRALADARAGRAPEGDMADLVDLLTRQLSGTAASRIRRANFLDLAAGTLAACRRRIDEGLPAVEALTGAIDQQRARLGGPLARQTRDELLASRRLWEGRIMARTAARWGFSPWALVLRGYQALGTLATGALLGRARSPAQLALWGAIEAGRAWRRRAEERRARSSVSRAVAGCWEQAELRTSAIVLEGYAVEAGIDREAASPATVAAEAEQAGGAFAEGVGADLDKLIERQADRHSRWYVRWFYESLLLAALGVILYRLGKNYFWDSWLDPTPDSGPFGLEFYVSSAIWLVLWCGLLIWAFAQRLRRGLARQIRELAERWTGSAPAAGLFARLDGRCREVDRFAKDLQRLEEQVAGLRRQLALPDGRLGYRR